MEYKANYGIDCWISPGFGVKYPDFVREQKVISADSPQGAYQSAMDLAGKFADDYLSNPETGLTIVQLLSLSDSDGDVPFDASKSVVKKSWLDHIVRIASLEDKMKEK